MAIKKAYEEVWDFLNKNKSKKVSDILSSVEELCSAKSGGGSGEPTFLKDAKGNVTHIRCYYHKMWEPVNPDGKGDDKHIEYGKKSTSPTGLNNMCKEGVSHWTKQQRAAKAANEQLLQDVAAGKIKPEKIPERQAEIEKDRTKIVPRKDRLGSKEMPKLK